MTGCREARTAALSALGIEPDGLATTVTLGSAAARSLAICSVRSEEGPTASDDLELTGIRLAEHVADRFGEIPLLIANRHDHRH